MGRRQRLLGPDLMRANFAAYDAAVEKALASNGSRKLTDAERSAKASAALAETSVGDPAEHAASNLFIRWVGNG